MSDDPRWRQNRGIRPVLRILGPSMLGLGLIFLIVGLADFFTAIGNMESPHHFWCVFVGLPLLGIGGAITSYGFLGATTRYLSGEIAPVAKDTLNYMADNTKDGVRTMAQAVGEGISSGLAGTGDKPAALLTCPKCAAKSPADSKFCKFCGASLAAKATCPHCHEEIDSDARFCAHCGKSVT